MPNNAKSKEGQQQDGEEDHRKRVAFGIVVKLSKEPLDKNAAGY